MKEPRERSPLQFVTLLLVVTLTPWAVVVVGSMLGWHR